MGERAPIVVRGVGDVGSAVAHRLFRAGHRVVIHDTPLPTTSRRGMAFTDAVFDGVSVLDGVTAVRVDDLVALPLLLSAGEVVPAVVADLPGLLAAVRPGVLVDARMRKRSRPELQRGLAPLTIGLGPNFVAGENVELAVETSWEDLGRVIAEGPTRALSAEPRPIAGHGRDRVVYSPADDVFRTTLDIGDRVEPGQLVARLGSIRLRAPLAGALRGLTRDGVPVRVGTKVIEVDPRGAEATIEGIGERPGRIADGVLEALLSRPRPD
jgi:xanthine dehydrogenase accessory factor